MLRPDSLFWLIWSGVFSIFITVGGFGAHSPVAVIAGLALAVFVALLLRSRWRSRSVRPKE
jgi:hypothetical protein